MPNNADMRFGIRLRFAVWLLAALLPVGVSAVYMFDRIEEAVSQRVAADLESFREIEAARIEYGVGLYRESASRLGATASASALTAAVVEAQELGTLTVPVVGDSDMGPIDPFAPNPLEPLASSLLSDSVAANAHVTELKIVGRNGEVLGETSGFDWVPVDESIISQAIATRESVVGNAYRDSDGQDRLGIVAPLMGVDDAPVGVLMLEFELGPIVDLLGAHEAFGATTEAQIFQTNVDGDAEAISAMRFEPDAAFSKVVPFELGLPVNVALSDPDGTVVFAKDYRGEDAILAVVRLEQTGWGLIVKIDRAEALAPVFANTTALKGIAALGMLGVLVGWAALLDPVARRLRRLADGAERVASGDYQTPLDDRSSDEIGSVAKSIDRLATDLAIDIAVRTDVENRLRHQATHDATTGLYSRHYATSLMQELSRAAAVDDETPAFSLLFLDLDKFKTINDQFGHAVGDAVLANAAHRLLTVVGDHGSVARWGGDEFLVVLPSIAYLGAKAMAQNIEHAFAPPIDIEGVGHQVRASIGASTFRFGTPLGTLLRAADEAMFIDKQNRAGTDSRSPDTIRAVERALALDEIEVHFQPLVAGRGDTLSLHGAEALVRLRDQRGNALEPAMFLRDIERSPIGRELDRRVLQNAVGHVARWIHSGALPVGFRLSVNCCQAFLSDEATPAFIAQTLAGAGLKPTNLMLEISEQASTIHPAIIDAVDQLGVTIAVDDLGMTNSTIDRLVEGRASVAKIDRRWMRSSTPEENETYDSVVRHLVSLCDSIGFDVIAEGVETPEQYAQMSGLGVSEFQGYLFARPLSVDDFEVRFLGSA